MAESDLKLPMNSTVWVWLTVGGLLVAGGAIGWATARWVAAENAPRPPVSAPTRSHAEHHPRAEHRVASVPSPSPAPAARAVPTKPTRGRHHHRHHRYVAQRSHHRTP
jgi:hypothetical protein